jgi:hypothetical protein
MESILLLSLRDVEEAHIVDEHLVSAHGVEDGEEVRRGEVQLGEEELETLVLIYDQRG